MTKRYQIMRISIFLPLAFLLLVACQWNAKGKLPATANVQASGQSNAGVQPGSQSNDGSAPGAAEALPVSPGTASMPAARFTEVEFARHVSQLKSEIKKKLASSDPRAPAAEFAVLIQPPLVVIGDESESALRQHAEGTVKWAVDRLKLDFFPDDPNEILDVWLFKDAASYQKHTRLMFGEEPTTPYGYYSIANKALIMNIDTGGGTLVHEIVHPFVEANFPGCPPWLNEGLGSLFEQCGDTDGHIHGFINWRLPGLQQAIQSKKLPPFKELMAMDANAFYNEDRGVNYAQARYLCYYLQQKGLLIKFYQQFHDRQQEDPSGYQTLQKILAETDMDAFKTKWEKYVLTLRQGYEVTVE